MNFILKRRLYEVYILLPYYYMLAFFCLVEYNLNQSFRLFIYCSCQDTKPIAQIWPVCSHFSYSSPCLMLNLRSRGGCIYTIYIYIHTMEPPDQVKSGLSPCWSRLVLSGVGWPCPDAEPWSEPCSMPIPWAFPSVPCHASYTTPPAVSSWIRGCWRDCCVQVNRHPVCSGSWAVPECPAAATAGSFGFSCESQDQQHHPSKHYQRLPFSSDFGHTQNNLKPM